MASMTKSCFIILFAYSLFIQASLAEVICHNLPEDLCAFAVASSGKRCVLEKFKSRGFTYACMESKVVVEKLAGHVESDQCVAACGVDRRLVGISSDALMTKEFLDSLCSPQCYDNCPNIVDLYLNLAAGEGAYLPTLCEKQKSNPQRVMLELRSNGGPPPATVADSTAPAPQISELHALL